MPEICYMLFLHTPFKTISSIISALFMCLKINLKRLSISYLETVFKLMTGPVYITHSHQMDEEPQSFQTIKLTEP